MPRVQRRQTEEKGMHRGAVQQKMHGKIDPKSTKTKQVGISFVILVVRMDTH